jgi:nitrogen fixation NifU-like protein
MSIKYNPKVIEHFKNPHNQGVIENPDAEALVGSPACGDQIAIYLKINNDAIEDIKFESYGCASNIATASIVTDLAKGKTLEEALSIKWTEAVQELGGLPPVKYHCSVLAVDGLRAAIKDYLRKTGRLPEEELSSDLVREELYHVIYPPQGLDIVSLKRVKYIGVDDGKVRIEISFAHDDPYLQEIIDEIKEKVSDLTGVKDLEVVNQGRGDL